MNGLRPFTRLALRPLCTYLVYLGKFASGMSEPVGLMTVLLTVMVGIIMLSSRPKGLSAALSDSKVSPSSRPFTPPRTAAQKRIPPLSKTVIWDGMPKPFSFIRAMYAVSVALAERLISFASLHCAAVA